MALPSIQELKARGMRLLKKSTVQPVANYFKPVAGSVRTRDIVRELPSQFTPQQMGQNLMSAPKFRFGENSSSIVKKAGGTVVNSLLNPFINVKDYAKEASNQYYGVAPQDTKKLTGMGLGAALDLGTMGLGSNLVTTAARGAIERVAPTTIKTLAPYLAKQAWRGSSLAGKIGAGYGLSGALTEGKGVVDTVKDTALGYGAGRVLGSAIGFGSAAVPALFKAGVGSLAGKMFRTADKYPYFSETSKQVGKGAHEFAKDIPRPGMSIKDVSGETPPQFSPKTKPMMKEPSINDQPLLSGRTPIAGVNDARPSAIAEARLKIKPQELNVNNLDLTPEQKIELQGIGANPERTRMRHKDVVAEAQTSTPLTSPITLEQTQSRAAQGLATRQEAVTQMRAWTKIQKSNVPETEKVAQFLKIGQASQAATSVGTEAGRMLEIQKQLADEFNSPMQRILKALHAAGVKPEQYAKDGAKVDFNNPKQVVDFYRKFVPAKAADWLDVFRYNSMLSSPLTQAVNIASSGYASGVNRPILKTVTGGVDMVRSKIFGGERKQFAGEGWAHAKTYWTSFDKGWSKFKAVFSGDSALDTPDYKHLPLTQGGTVGRKVENTLSFPMKILEGMDQLFMEMGTQAETASLRYRASKGVKVKNMGEAATNEARKAVFRGALGDSDQGHLLQLIDKPGMGLMGWRDSKNPVARYFSKFTFPFIPTPTNLGKAGLESTPGLGLLTIPGAANKEEQIAKQILGAGTFLAAAAIFSEGRSTWSEPTNQTQKNEARAAGIQPYSVKLPGTNIWIQYNKLPPQLAFPIALVAALEQSKQERKITDDDIEVVMKTVAKGWQFMADQTYFKTIGGLVDFSKGGEGAVGQIISNYWMQTVPFRALGGWITRMVDHVQRKVDPTAGFLEKQLQLLMLNMPVLSQNVPARLDQFGNPIKSQHPFVNAISPLRISTENPEMKEFYDTHQEVLKQNRQKDQIKELLNQGTPIPEGMIPDGGVKGDGKIIPMAGQFWTKLDKRGFVAFDSEEEANIARNKDAFQKSGKAVDTIDGMVYRRNKKGDALPPMLEEDYNERLYPAILQKLYNEDDYKTWMQVAQKRYQNLEQQLQDPTVDELDTIAIQNKMDALVKKASLYKRYGGFKKPKAPKKRKAIKLKTTSTTAMKARTRSNSAPQLYSKSKPSSSPQPVFTVGSGFKVR